MHIVGVEKILVHGKPKCLTGLKALVAPVTHSAMSLPTSVIMGESSSLRLILFVVRWE